jgi:mutator protein MutT
MADAERTEVTAAVIERDGRVLIARRRRGSHLEGLWEFPGGKRRPDESLSEALRREIREELDAVVDVGEVVEVVDWEYPGVRLRLHFFRCTLSGEPRSMEGQELAWVEPADLGRYEFPPADARLIARLSGA